MGLRSVWQGSREGANEVRNIISRLASGGDGMDLDAADTKP